MERKKIHMLVILDGFGYSSNTKYNAIYHAKTPVIDSLTSLYPQTILQAAGKAVGLPEGYIGNSEVGHLTIGAGQIIPQPITIINNAIAQKTFFSNEALIKSLEKIKKTGARLHIMGLLSNAGVHAHIDHICAYLQAAKMHGITDVFLHPFLDGRDSPPKSAVQFLHKLDECIATAGVGKIATITGRFYAMDRDNNWERTKACYNVFTSVQMSNSDSLSIGQHLFGNGHESWEQVVQHDYDNNITDEFIMPTQIDPAGIIQPGDGIIYANFRPDRARQLTTLFIEKNFPYAFFLTPFSYADDLKTTTMFTKKEIKGGLAEILSSAGKSVCKIAETEKYAHVTYFFNGFKEKPFPGEKRILIDSIKRKNYVDCPRMSADKITAAVIHSLQHDASDFYVINYANADMVGHSGNFQATVKAVECLDEQLKKLYDVVIEKMNGIMYVTADHGKAELMFDEKTGQPNTAHTTNPVPFIFIKKELEGRKDTVLTLHQLSDIAPFILKQMGVTIEDQ